MKNTKTTENEKKSFASRVKETMTELMAKLIVYLSENPGAMIPLIGVFGQIIGAGAAIYTANSNKQNKAIFSKDDVTGERYKLIHELTNDEILELSSRMADGNSKGEALETMGLLKHKKH